MKLNRYQAFGAHLLGSLVVALLTSALVFLVWYEWPLATVTGVTEIFLILLAVDVVIGPFLTLVVFNPAKKELKRDLLIILLFQIAALLMGVHTVYIARPVYLVFNVDRFDLVYANDLTDEKIKNVTDPRFQSVPFLRPKVIAAKSPDDKNARNKILLNAVQGGDDIPQLPQYYVTYDDMKVRVLERIRSLDELKLFNSGKEDQIAAIGSKYSSIKEGVGYLPLRGKVGDLTVIVRRDSAEVLDVVALNPWK